VTEQSAVTFGSTRIAYQIRRSPRRKTVSIAVLPTDGVLITAPPRTSVPRLDALVHEKARWIMERLRNKRDIAETRPTREFVSGESYSYLGRQYRLRVVPDAAPAPLALKAGWFHLAVPRGLGEEHRPGYVRAALVDWYQRRARERLPAKVAAWAKKAGVPEPGVLVRDQQKRWASCDASGTIRVNWRILQASPRLLDYVLAHEVVHLVHDDHGAEFWSLLGRIMPDYEDRRRELRRVGARFEW
jgi:predicted metal-dependent hydrolase